MKYINLKIASAGTVLVLMLGGGLAQADGITIEGSNDQSVFALGSITNIGLMATQEIASVVGEAEIQGDNNQSVFALGSITNMGMGACQMIATVSSQGCLSF